MITMDDVLKAQKNNIKKAPTPAPSLRYMKSRNITMDDVLNAADNLNNRKMYGGTGVSSQVGLLPVPQAEVEATPSANSGTMSQTSGSFGGTGHTHSSGKFDDSATVDENNRVDELRAERERLVQANRSMVTPRTEWEANNARIAEIDNEIHELGARTKGDFIPDLARAFAAGVTGASRRLLDALSDYGYQQAINEINQNQAALLALGNNDAAAQLEADKQTMTSEGPYQFNYAQNYLDDTAKRIQGHGKVARVALEVAQGVGDMLPSIAANYIIPGSGLTVMFAQAAAGATREAMDNGADFDKAAVYGLAVGAVEVITEKISGGIPGTKSSGWLDNLSDGLVNRITGDARAQACIKFIFDALEEGGEEFISEFADHAINQWTVKDDDRNWSEVSADAMYSFLIGALTGAVLDLPANFIGMTAEQKRKALMEKADEEIAKAAEQQNMQEGNPQIAALNGEQEVVQNKQDATQNAQVNNQQLAALNSNQPQSNGNSIVLPKADVANNGGNAIMKENGTEVTDNGRGTQSAGGEGRSIGMASAEQSTGVAERGAEAGTERSGAEIGRRDIPQDYRSGVSLGIETAVDTDEDPTHTLREHTDYTTEEKELIDTAAKNGQTVHLYTGDLWCKDGNGNVYRVRGLIHGDGKTIWVKADHSKYSVQQVYDHENYHAEIKKNPAILQDGIKRIKKQYARDPAGLNDLIQTYVKNYRIDTTGMSVDDILEEILCDAHAGITVRSTSAKTGETKTVDLKKQADKALKAKNKTVSSYATARYSIDALPDGRKYVKFDRQVILGEDSSKWGRQVENYINEKIRNGEDVFFQTSDGHVLVLTGRSAYKLTDRHKSSINKTARDILTDNDYAIKLRASEHIDELIQVAKFSGYEEDLNNAHENDVGEDGFNYFRAFFEDFDGKYYEIPVSSALNGENETGYSIGNPRKRKKPTISTGSSVAKNGAQDGRLSNSIISESGFESQEEIPEWKKKLAEFGENELKEKVNNSEPVAPDSESKASREFDEEYMDAADKKNEKSKFVSLKNMLQARKDRARIAEFMKDIADMLPADITGNTFYSDSSYGGSEESTTVCPRSMAYEEFLDAVADELGRPLTAEDTVFIAQEAMALTDKPECLYCYVAMDRKAYREFLGKYIEQRDAFLADIRSGMEAGLVKPMKKSEAKDGKRSIAKDSAYGKFLNGRANTENMYKRAQLWMDSENLITKKDLASVASMNRAAQNKELRAQIADAMAYAQSASWAKKKVGYAAYNNHILNWSKAKVDKLNKHYGMRMYSFSDFSPAFILENMQMLTDAAVRGLKVLGYTKELDFVRIFAPTGMNINISVFGYTDWKTGKIAMDAMQGADWTQAQDLRSKYDNVGCTFVATSDAQVEWALAQDWIDVVIPFHLVRTGANVASMFGWKNYTDMSADKKNPNWKKGDSKSIYPSEHQNDKDLYLELCEENNLTPRFEKWLENPNYMKLVNETRRSDGETKPVQPIFDVDAAEASLKEMVKQGGYVQHIGGTSENMSFLAGETAKKIQNAKPGEIREEIGKRSGAAKASRDSDAEYMELAKDPEKNREAMDEIVRAEAERNGYETVQQYHGTTAFGFTQFDVGMGDGLIFVTDNINLSGIYSEGRNKVRPVHSENITIEQAQKKNASELVSAANKNNYTSEYKIADRHDVSNAIAEQKSRFNEAIEGLKKLRDTDKVLRGTYQSMINSVEKMRDSKNYRAYTKASDEYFKRYDRLAENYRIISEINSKAGAKMLEIASNIEALNDVKFRPWSNVFTDGEKFWSKSEFISVAYPSLSGHGIYGLYANKGNNITLETQDVKWNRITRDMITDKKILDVINEQYRGIYNLNTRQVSHAAMEAGYDSITFNGMLDPSVKSNITVMFNSNQVKSSDTVTYDDNGNVIPPSQRFKSESNDIRYSRADLDDDIQKYGEMEAGENPARDVHMPNKTSDNRKLSQTVRTILEAKVTPDTMVPTIEDLASQEEFSYEVYGDKQAVSDAEAKLKYDGWDKALEKWKSNIRSGKVSKKNTTMGWVLYNNAATDGNVATAIDILNGMVQHQRSAAQALQATRILKKMSPDAQLYAAVRSVQSIQDEMNEQYGEANAPKIVVDPGLAQRYLNAKTEDDRIEALKDIYVDVGRQLPSRFRDRMNAWRYLAMLGNARTHVRNVIGNAGFAPIVMAKNLTATAIESAVSRVGNIDRTKALVSGKGGKEILSAAWNDFNKMSDVVMGDSKYADEVNANKEVRDGRVIFGNTKSELWNKTGGKVLETVRIKNGEFLDKEDKLFSQPHYAYAMAQYCKANGITAAQIKSGKGLEKARDYAVKEAQKATYRDTNAFSQFVSSLGRNGKNSTNPVKKTASFLVEGILPFRKTPANILVRGMEYSPAGLIKALTVDLAKVKNGTMSASEAIDNIAAGLTGTGLMALGMLLTSFGLIRGHGSDNEKEADFEKMLGHQNYSLELPGGMSVTLDWLAPEAIPFFVGVNLWEQTAAKGESVTFDTLVGAISNVSEPVLEMSCLQGLNNLFENYMYSSSTNGLTKTLTSASTSYLMQFVPTILGQIERTAQDKRMTTYTSKSGFIDNTEVQRFFGNASAKIPGWDYRQIPYIDAWGREESSGGLVKRALNNMLNPAYTSDVEISDMENELMRLYDATGEGGVFPSRADKSFTVDGATYLLSPDEYVRYAKMRGEAAYAIVTDLTESAAYQNMSDADKADAVRNAYQYAQEVAQYNIGGRSMTSWVAKAMDAYTEYRVPVYASVAAKALTNGVESLTDENGKSITNSPGLQKMEIIYNSFPGLSRSKLEYLFELCGVGKSVIGYSKQEVAQALRSMR